MAVSRAGKNKFRLGWESRSGTRPDQTKAPASTGTKRARAYRSMSTDALFDCRVRCRTAAASHGCQAVQSCMPHCNGRFCNTQAWMAASWIRNRGGPGESAARKRIRATAASVPRNYRPRLRDGRPVKRTPYMDMVICLPANHQRPARTGRVPDNCCTFAGILGVCIVPCCTWSTIKTIKAHHGTCARAFAWASAWAVLLLLLLLLLVLVTVEKAPCQGSSFPAAFAR